MKNLIISLLMMSYVIGCSPLFGQDGPSPQLFIGGTNSVFDKEVYEYVYAMKYPLRIRDGQIFDYHAETFPDYLANNSKGMPRNSKPFGFTSNEEHICYFVPLDKDWSQIVLRSAKDGTIQLIYPQNSRELWRSMIPKIPIISSQDNLVAMLAKNNGLIKSGTWTSPVGITSLGSRFSQYLVIVDITSGKTLHAIPALDSYNSRSLTVTFESREFNTTPRWPSEDLALFMPDDSGIFVRQSGFQIDLYDFDLERTVQSFSVLKTHGVKSMIYTFMLTDEGYLRTFLSSSGPYFKPLRDRTEVPDYIDWDIKTGEIVREGPLRESVIH